jgi:sec-independent protein translocase protein TatA
MGSLSVWHWLLFLAVALLMFGGSGKISSIMGDVAKGIKSFKKGMAEDEEKPAEAPTPPEPKVIEHKAEVEARATKPASRPKPTRSRKSG